MPHHVLNARHEEAEAAIVARAGERGAVTISTNMAGRGVDIRLGDGVAALGGLHVIGTNRHESRAHRSSVARPRRPAGRSRQLAVLRLARGSAVRASTAPAIRDVPSDQLQRMAEGQNLDIRLFLRKYESVIEGQRLAMRARREACCSTRAARRTHARSRRSTTIDDLWADYLAAVAELRAGTLWLSLGGKDPLRRLSSPRFTRCSRSWSGRSTRKSARAAGPAAATDAIVRERGATWTYLTTDEPFGPMTERIMRNLVTHIRAIRAKSKHEALKP